jgi:hypothetical protein
MTEFINRDIVPDDCLVDYPDFLEKDTSSRFKNDPRYALLLPPGACFDDEHGVNSLELSAEFFVQGFAQYGSVFKFVRDQNGSVESFFMNMKKDVLKGRCNGAEAIAAIVCLKRYERQASIGLVAVSAGSNMSDEYRGALADVQNLAKRNYLENLERLAVDLG